MIRKGDYIKMKESFKDEEWFNKKTFRVKEIIKSKRQNEYVYITDDETFLYRDFIDNSFSNRISSFYVEKDLKQMRIEKMKRIIK